LKSTLPASAASARAGNNANKPPTIALRKARLNFVRISVVTFAAYHKAGGGNIRFTGKAIGKMPSNLKLAAVVGL
jgi:hypothetical protein